VLGALSQPLPPSKPVLKQLYNHPYQRNWHRRKIHPFFPPPIAWKLLLTLKTDENTQRVAAEVFII